MRRRKPRCFIYARVSTNKGQQDTRNQVHDCHEYARKLGLKVHDVITVETSSQKSRKARKLDVLFDQLQIGDTLLTSEISRLGRSISEIFRMIDEEIKGKINLHCIKESIVLLKDEDPSINTTMTIGMFSIMAEVERRLISERVKSGLRNAQRKGKVLGRQKGERQHVPLDDHRDRILELLDYGLTPKVIAERHLNVNPASLYYWLDTRGVRSRKKRKPRKEKKPRKHPESSATVA